MGINPDVVPEPFSVSEGKDGLAPIYRTDRKEFAVSPGKRFRYVVYFATEGSGPQVDISVYKDGKRLPPIMNNYTSGTREWSTAVNDTGGDITYTILGWFKLGYNQGPDWTTGWLNHRSDFFGSCTAFLQFMPFAQHHGLIPWHWWWEERSDWMADIAVHIE